jgi:3-hydroxyisobutyrate dehydrogenase-like beta-hydroxyacid dehydrogenase
MADGGVEQVAFIGLGRMGAPMARNILRAGYDLTVFNRTTVKMKPLVEQGAKAAASPKAAAAGADVIITCLMDDESMMEIIAGEKGLLAGLKPGGIHVGTATISPGCAAKLANIHQNHGSVYLSGPIFGRPTAAAAGTLLTYVAGDAKAAAACEPLFATYAETFTYVGADHRIANSIKLAFNFLLISMVEVFSEIFTFAEKSHIDPDMMEAMVAKVLAHPALKEYIARIRSRDFEPAAFELRAGFKDVELMLNASSGAQASLGIASLVREKFITALASGMAEKDWSAIYEVTRQNAGLS